MNAGRLGLVCPYEQETARHKLSCSIKKRRRALRAYPRLRHFMAVSESMRNPEQESSTLFINVKRSVRRWGWLIFRNLSRF